ncbi:MAG: diadenylate cyclase CdaA [Defluviitaleaceae bacterium]|nr:diadenylate cyclase CdaA [Defluviitaleaceae bacterium]
MFSRVREWISEINIPSLGLPGIGFVEIVDIIIVAYIVYFVLKWIRQTRAWSLLKGLITILFIAAVAFLFNLATVQWILQYAFAMGLIVVVVLFQPEFRKGLEQIGRGKFFASIYKGEHGRQPWVGIHTVNEVTKAVEEMSAAKMGALIVFEKEVALGDHERTGIAVDAAVSSQLLLNIFESNTPLHDGAVIIRNNRVTAAACILPLTAEEIGHDMGTRHRAAVGISELSDALVVVVSEETGAISIAEGGAIAKNQNISRLREIFLTSAEGEKPLQSLIKNVKHARVPFKKPDGGENA